MKQPFLLLLAFFLCIHTTQAQEIPYLEKPVTINFSNTPVTTIFQSISEQTGVVFTYSSFDDQKKISIVTYNKTLRMVLNQLSLLCNNTYKLKGKYVIIKPSPTTAPLHNHTDIVLSGYIYSTHDSNKIDKASVYIEASKRSSITNEYGYFSISNINVSSPLKLKIAKQNYVDTTINIVSKKDVLLAVYLQPKQLSKQEITIDTTTLNLIQKDSLVNAIAVDSASTPPDLFEQLQSGFKKFNANIKNITDTMFSNFSFSLAPYLSTNRFLSANTINNTALNLTVGYSKGVRLLEIGGIMNINEGNVNYFQVAGIGNLVSGNVLGVQLGGLLNINKAHTNGLQISGLYNDSYKINGLQIAGLMNNSNDINGMQIAGIVNRSTKHVKGIQIAGLINHSEYTGGAQVATINITKKIKGIQLGFINISDTCKGIPIGFFNYVKTGYHKLELSYDELHFGTLSFETGVSAFHTIFLGGYNFSVSGLYTYGYGIGSSIKISRSLNLKFDLTAQQIQSSEFLETSLNTLGRFYTGLELAPFKGIRIGIGPTYNVFIADTRANHSNKTTAILPSYLLYDQLHTNTFQIKAWLGAKIALKFF